MKSLPFHVKPRQETRDVGNPDTGILRFPVFLSLTLAERIQVREVDRSDDVFKATADLVISIVDRQSPDPLPEGYDRQQEIARVYAIVNRLIESPQDDAVGLPPEEVVIMVLFADDISEVRRQSEQNEEAKIVRACTAIIGSRLEGYDDWSDDDTSKLPEDLISAVFDFYRAELAHMSDAPDLDQLRKNLEDALGELQMADGSRPPNPTGEPSSGDSATLSPEPESFIPSDSPISPSPTFSKPSRRPRR
jgi:hypothetical protein